VPTSHIHASFVSASSKHTCAIIDGLVGCWGSNDKGQLGIPADGETGGFGSPYLKAEFLSAGKSATCAINSGQEVKCWGDGAVGKVPLK